MSDNETPKAETVASEPRKCVATLAEEQARTREWALALQSLTPGGSEYVDDPARCVAFIRESRESQHATIIKVTVAQRESERQLAAAEKRAKDAEGQIDDVLFCAYKFDDKPHQLFNAIRRVAEASTRCEAGDKDEIVRLMGEEYERPSRAALTRKLATAREAMASSLPLLDKPFTPIAIGIVVRRLTESLATIDAPAGEEAKRCRVGADFDEQHACNKPLPCPDHPAPPPEPANAQGSEGAPSIPRCASVECERVAPSGMLFCCGGCPASCVARHTVECDARNAPPSAPPFTSEEARESARAHATAGARLKSDDDGTEYTERFAAEHLRTAATMRTTPISSNATMRSKGRRRAH